MDDELAIDRYALDWLPGEVALIARWVQETSELWHGWPSEATDEEKQLLRPGLDLLVELIGEELEDARAGARRVRASLTAPLADLVASDPGRWRPPARAEQVQQSWRRDARAVLRGYLRDVLSAAKSIGIPTEELPGLLDQVLSADQPGAQGQPADVVPLSARRRATPRQGER